ncbi:response regulator [Chryseolinea lacunae]|uniref:Response regulator n=1 Tax=Chryseolinea lacunae TaxID=2801331 RepID=A0ABS1L200_9BACT|nr:response regulator [Chryseolinea lacunae]MBL0745743.1 response regulator [Chryseolinea lacunae]
MKTVLIIEDNLEIRENTTEVLELEGFEVHAADNGQVGMALAIGLKPDIILCDIMMPEVDGYEVLRRLKEDPVTNKIPFICVTASGEKMEIQRAMELGASGFVRKPFDVKELIRVMRKCLL